MQVVLVVVFMVLFGFAFLLWLWLMKEGLHGLILIILLMRHLRRNVFGSWQEMQRSTGLGLFCSPFRLYVWLHTQRDCDQRTIMYREKVSKRFGNTIRALVSLIIVILTAAAIGLLVNWLNG